MHGGIIPIDWGQQINRLLLPGVHCFRNQVSLIICRSLEEVCHVLARLHKLCRKLILSGVERMFLDPRD
jgi:hypothetical protein